MQNDEGWLTHLFAGVESQSEIPSANHLHLKGKAKAVTPSLIYITNRDLWRNDSELYYNGNMDWNMDISEIPSNGTYYFCRCYDYRSGY